MRAETLNLLAAYVFTPTVTLGPSACGSVGWFDCRRPAVGAVHRTGAAPIHIGVEARHLSDRRAARSR